jgi:hypothetical protein
MSELTRVLRPPTGSIMMDLRKIVEIQLHIHFLLQEKILSPALCSCLAIIAERGTMPLLDICNEAYDEDIYGNPMSARCALNKAVKEGILVKGSEGHRKTLSLSPDIPVAHKGNILLTYQFGRKE